MTPLLLKIAAALVALFTASLGAIHARPYDDAAIRAFLAPPDDCPVPCWQGIRPGASPASDAYRLLMDQPWVEDVDVYVHLNAIAWTWNGAQPSWIDASEPGLVAFGGLGVEYVRLRTTLSFGDLWLALGRPDTNNVRLTGTHRRLGVEHNAAYFDGTLSVVRAPLSCRLPIRDYWERKVEILLDHRRVPTLAAGGPYRPFDPYARPFC